MADFVNRKPAKAPGKKNHREILTIAAPKQGQSGKEEHPISALKKVARDFKVGLATLQRLSTNVPTATSTNTERVVERTTNNYVEKASRSSQHDLTDRLTRERIDHTSPTTQRAKKQRSNSPSVAIRTPAPLSTESRQRPLVGRPGRIPARATVTGADREARRHFDGSNKEGMPNTLPSAARLAQILRANELMENEVIPKHQQVQEWAQAIVSGKRRTISDIDPAHVERILHASVGGASAAARLLNTPEVAKLVDRHHTILSTLHCSSGGSVRGGSAFKGERGHAPSRPQPHQHIHTANLSNLVTEPMLEAPAGKSTQEELETMLATNEEPHLMEQAQQAQNELAPSMVGSGATAGFPTSQHKPREPKISGYAVDPPDPEQVPRETIVGRAHAAKTAIPNGHAAALEPTGSTSPSQPPAQQRRPVSAGMAAAPEAKRDVSGAMPAPPPRSTVTTPAQASNEKSRKKDKMELSGTLTLISKGQTIGEAKINGMMG